jgi:CubicO group peptidase (beta-lactamase class C family)
MSQWRLNWPVDSRYEYHATSMHWVLTEIILRRTGQDYKTFIRERITAPAGLDELYVGCPREQQYRVADIIYVGEHVPPPGGYGEVTPELVMNFNKPKVREAGVPGGGAVASAGTVALFYQLLINGGVTADGKRVMPESAIEFGTKVRSRPHHIDQTMQLIDPNMIVNTNRGLSVVVAGDDGYAYARGFGRTCSGRAFGHGGAGGQIAWGDPETGISLGYCTNGFVDFMTIGRRITALSSLAGSCLA